MRTRQATINIAAGLIGLLITTIMGFVSSAIFARSLGVELSGLNNVLVNVVSILSVTELGIAGAINFNLYKPALEKDYAKISRIMTFYRKCYVVIGIVILIVSLVASGFIHTLLKDSTLTREYILISFLLCAASTVLSYFLVYHRNLLYVFQENYLASIVDMIVRVISTSLQIFCLLRYRNYHLFLLINMLYTFTSNLIIALIVRKRYPQINMADKTKDLALQRNVMHDVKSLAVIQIGSAMINFTSSIIISKVLGIRTAGMYAYYATLITMLSSIVNMIYSNLGAGIGNLQAENKRENSIRVFQTLTHLSFLMGLFIASGIGNASKAFIVFWVGSEFLLSYEVATILAVNFFIMVQRQVVTYYLRTGGHHGRMILALVVEAIVNLGVSILLAAQYGLLGVFSGVLLSSLIGWHMNSMTLSSVLGISVTKYVGTQAAYLMFFTLQLLVSGRIVNSLNLQTGLLMQFVISGIISIGIPLIATVLSVLYNPVLLPVRERMLSFRKR